MWARVCACSHTMPEQQYGQPTPIWWVMGICMFRCKLPAAVLAEWRGSFTCHCGNMGVEWTPNQSQHTKLTLEKKILPPLLLGFKLTTFWSWVRRSNQQAISAPPDTVWKEVTHHILNSRACGPNVCCSLWATMFSPLLQAPFLFFSRPQINKCHQSISWP